MKITDEELEEGRALVRGRNTDALFAWVDKKRVVLDKELLRRTMLNVIAANPDRAIKLFDAVFVGMDPDFDRRVLKIRLGVRFAVALVVLLGCLGGVIYLVRSIF